MNGAGLPTIVRDASWVDWIEEFPALQGQDHASLVRLHADILHHIGNTPPPNPLDRREARDLAEDLMLLYEDIREFQSAEADGSRLDLAVAGLSLAGAILVPAAAIPLAVTLP